SGSLPSAPLASNPFLKVPPSEPEADAAAAAAEPEEKVSAGTLAAAAEAKMREVATNGTSATVKLTPAALPAVSSSTVSGGFIFGKNISERVVQKGAVLDVVIESSVKTQTHQWVVDGKPHTRTLDDGREATSVHRFEAGALVTTTTGRSVGGDAYTLVSTRALVDAGKTTRLDLACTIDGSTTKATRVFRREE
ncbi:MAG: hypothetical protein AAF211_23235, partial [Myxococcota bacterium]